MAFPALGARFQIHQVLLLVPVHSARSAHARPTNEGTSAKVHLEMAGRSPASDQDASTCHQPIKPPISFNWDATCDCCLHIWKSPITFYMSRLTDPILKSERNSSPPQASPTSSPREPCHGTGREAAVADGVGADQRGGAAQPGAAVHGEGRTLCRERFAGAEEALDFVHRGTT